MKLSLNWETKGIEYIVLENTNYSLRKKVYNGVKVWQVYNFNECIGMADKLGEAKKIIKNELSRG